MNKEQVLMQLKDLLFNFENFEEVETTEDDVQALEYAIKELEKTAPEVPAKFVVEDSNDISKESKRIKAPLLETLNDLEEICKPVIEYLIKNYDPHCSIIVSDNQIKLIRTEIGIPVKSDD